MVAHIIQRRQGGAGAEKQPEEGRGRLMAVVHDRKQRGGARLPLVQWKVFIVHLDRLVQVLAE